MDDDQDQMELKTVEVFDPVQKRRYNVFVEEDNLEVLQADDLEDDTDMIFKEEDTNIEPNTTWSQNETLALINIFSLHKDKFRNFKIKKDRWKLVSRELAKIGIEKLPTKCEIKWRNLLRTYRIYKHSDKSQGKFEFFNELDDIISNDPQFKYIYENVPGSFIVKNDYKQKTTDQLHLSSASDLQESSEPLSKRKRCTTCKSQKQKRHDERMVLLRKKLELEERKVKVFEDYVQFLKSTHPNGCRCNNY